MNNTIEFFERKGLAPIKEDDYACRWYEDFLQFIQDEEIFAFIISDYAQYALAHLANFTNTAPQEVLLKTMLQKPVLDPVTRGRIWNKHVLSLIGQFTS